MTDKPRPNEGQKSDQENRTQANKEEAPIKALEGKDQDPEATDVLQGFFVELTEKGVVRRKFYGKSQNIALMLGLVSYMQLEIEQRQKLQKGFLPSAELTAIGGLISVMQNIGNVLIQVQGAMSGINNMIKALPDEFRKIAGVESSMDAESEQE